MARHLDKLPPKSFDVAPGDVIGGLIYVMDKPLGIEEGMVGISVDSPVYREYVKTIYTLLDKIKSGQVKLEEVDVGEYPHIKQLYERYQTLHEVDNNFQNKNEKDKIDALLKDKVHVKKRHGASWKEFKNVFTSFSKYHEMKGWQSYYVNEGMGGLLFDGYKNKCGIKKTDHFATHIGKLIDKGNQAYMIKQDGEMALGGTGPGWRKMLKTNTGKSLQKLVNPWVILLTGGLSAVVFGAAMLGWRGFYLKKNKPAVSNSDAIIEALSTKMASKRGISSQEIDTINGTYPDGTPKIATIVTWAKGCRDLSGKLSGSTDFSSVVVTWDKNDKSVKVDKEGNIIRTKDKDAKGNITSYEKVGKNGKILKATKAEYEAAHAVSDDSIAGLGESLISFISMGDRDGIGKAGQNKAIMPINPPQREKAYQFFGIDFGKSYKEPNPIVQSLRDDFSFDNPAGRQSRFVNYSMLYDNPLREKMKGVYLLAALRDKLAPDLKEEIAKQYEVAGDKQFAAKLRSYPEAMGGINCDLNLINDEIKKYDDLAKNEQLLPAQREQYQHYATRLKDMKKIAKETDDIILDKFSARLSLTPQQIDLLDNIEKLTARNVHTLSPDGKVQLNHLRVDKDDRCAWQINANANGTFDLTCQEKQRQIDVKQRLLALHSPEINNILQRGKIEKGKLTIQNITKAELALLSTHLTEENVAKTRHVDYRSQEKRNTFHHRLHMAAKNEAKLDKKPQPHPEPHRNDNPIVNANINVARKLEVPEHDLIPRNPHVGFMYRAVEPRQMAKRVTPVLIHQNANWDELKSFINKEENKLKFNIVHIEAFQTTAFKDNHCLAVTFKHPEENRECKIFLEPSKDGIRFSFPKNLDKEAFIFTAQAMSDLLSGTAKPSDEWVPCALQGAQKEIIEQALKSGIESAISQKPFDVNSNADKSNRRRNLDL